MHLNPVRGKLLRPEQPLSDYGWSSYPEYLKGPRKRPGWLRVDRLLGEWAKVQFERTVAERGRYNAER